MKIAITTPTGHVGSAVADFLLDFGDDFDVILLARRPEGLRRFTERGGQMQIGSLDDAAFLTRATQDVDALFWVTPPGYGSYDVRAFQNRLGNAAATAVRTNHIARVVNLSSIGAQLSSGVGPINGLHDVEKWLDDATGNIAHLRPGFFFENLLWQVDSMRKLGKISAPLSGTQRYPMVATQDIGRIAVRRLMDCKWSGHCVREIHGPADLSFDEAAGILSKVLDRKIAYVKCDPQEMRHVLLGNAISENAADLMLEMYDAVETGRLFPVQPRSAETTTPTTLAEFAHDKILPMMNTPVAR